MPSAPKAEKNLSPRIFLSAGEASGEHYGAQIIAEMRSRIPGMTCFGLGGTEMEAAGLERIVRAEDVAVMGITEVVRHMPHIYAEYRRLVASIKGRRPDIAVLIDFPDVNFRLAKVLKKLGIPVVWFVSPQLWAWKRSRLRWVQQRVSRMLVIFPFEEQFYRARGVEAKFVGHPLATLALPAQTREEFAAQYGLDAAKPWIALLPGSRRKEVHLNLAEMVKAAAMLRKEQVCEVLLPVASTVGQEFVRIALLELGAEAWVTLVDYARAAMHHARASLVASGTATVQAAVIGNPFVVVYRVSPVTYAIAKRVVTVPHVAMVNLVADKRLVPELIQDDFTGDRIVQELGPLLADGSARTEMMAGLTAVAEKLRGGRVSNQATGETAIGRVASIVMETLLKPTSQIRDVGHPA
jgi:lipid-A-disaccharide synthase